MLIDLQGWAWPVCLKQPSTHFILDAKVTVFCFVLFFPSVVHPYSQVRDGGRKPKEWEGGGAELSQLATFICSSA